jgi:copper(I)-binding protein
MTMKKSHIAIAAALLLTAAGGYFAMHRMDHGGRAMQMSVEAGNLTISDATARFLIKDRPGAVFLTIDNEADADKLLSATSPLSPRVELHTHIMDDGVMKMRPIEVIDVTAKGKTELKSGGLHIMMFDVKELPAKGTMVPLTLHFENAGNVEIKAMVGEPGMAHSN